MTDESKEEIQVILELLKGCLIKNGVSIALKDENICFFDTDYYLRTSNLYISYSLIYDPYIPYKF